MIGANRRRWGTKFVLYVTITHHHLVAGFVIERADDKQFKVTYVVQVNLKVKFARG